MEYFGKPHQCYQCHIKKVYKSWEKIIENRKSAIEKLCTQYNIPEERFRRASLLTVAFHDAGKPSGSFQEAMYAIASKESPTEQPLECSCCKKSIRIPELKKHPKYRHEIIGGVAALHFGSKAGNIGGINFPFEFFSVIGHHKLVNPDTFRREWDQFTGQIKELDLIGYGEEEWNHVMEIAIPLFEKENLPFSRPPWNEVNSLNQPIIDHVKENIDSVPLSVQEIIDQSGNLKVIGQIRETLALLKSILIAADWEASSEKDIHSSVDVTPSEFWDQVRQKIEEDSSKKFSQRDFQKQLTQLSGHGIAVAPTGSGKTEGAIAWALANKTLHGKILYVLPNQVLTNSIYERLIKFFGKNNVGLLHSGALLYQIHNRVNPDEAEQYDPSDLLPSDEEKHLHKLNRMMFRPIMVTTVDQLLMIAFNGNKRWSVIMGELMGGAIIFDEIHAYDGHMLALLERVTRELRSHAPLLFMSATMPDNLVAFLSGLVNITGDRHIVKDTSLLNMSRNRYSVFITTSLVERGKIAKEPLKKIERFITEGKRVAVICNTVKNAQMVYSQLKNDGKFSPDKAMCLHSRFIAKDRREKESRLEKNPAKTREDQDWPLLLTATQVIECGMDIDYDVLFTEGAPLEALIQRAGRINRERRSEPGEIYIYKQDEASQKFYPPEITESALKKLDEKIRINPSLTEEDLNQMVNRIYEGKKFENDLRFQKTRKILDDVIYDIGAIQDLPETDLHTRFVTYKMVEIIPEQFWEFIKDENQFVIMDYLIKMPLWAYLSAKIPSDDERWKVMRMNYSDDIGGSYLPHVEKYIGTGTLFA